MPSSRLRGGKIDVGLGGGPFPGPPLDEAEQAGMDGAALFVGRQLALSGRGVAPRLDDAQGDLLAGGFEVGFGDARLRFRLVEVAVKGPPVHKGCCRRNEVTVRSPR